MFFDAHLTVSGPPTEAWPPDLAGAIVYGLPSPSALPGCWLLAATQSQIAPTVQPEARYKVVDLQLPSGELLARLKRPKAEWFPLADSVRQKKQFLRLNLPPGASTVVGTRKLAEHFPHARFLIDPFLHGSVDGWQAQVRLAEGENVWLTTRGLFPGSACRWTRGNDVEEALHFTMGEVGASKLLFASGHAPGGDAFYSTDPQKWLAEIRALDEDQRALILELNARELFG